MARKKALDIKKRIIELLKKHKEMSIRELETKANTNHNTMLTQLEELEYFGLLSLHKPERSDRNGRPYTSVRLKR